MKFLTNHFTGEQLALLYPLIEMLQSSEMGEPSWEIAIMQLKSQGLYEPLMELLKEEYSIYRFSNEIEILYFSITRSIEIYNDKVQFDIAGGGNSIVSSMDRYSCSHKLPLLSKTLHLKVISSIEILNSNNIGYPIYLTLGWDVDIIGLQNDYVRINCNCNVIGNSHKISNVIKECESMGINVWFDTLDLSSLIKLKHLVIKRLGYNYWDIKLVHDINKMASLFPPHLETVSFENASDDILLESLLNCIPTLPNLHKIVLPQGRGDKYEQTLLQQGFIRDYDDVFIKR